MTDDVVGRIQSTLVFNFKLPHFASVWRSQAGVAIERNRDAALSAPVVPVADVPRDAVADLCRGADIKQFLASPQEVKALVRQFLKVIGQAPQRVNVE